MALERKGLIATVMMIVAIRGGPATESVEAKAKLDAAFIGLHGTSVTRFGEGVLEI